MSAAPGPARWPADYRVTIVGLGLMGGSIARALAPHRPAALWAVDRDPAVLERRGRRASSPGFTDAREPLGRSDLVIVCLRSATPSDGSPKTVSMQKAVITDICGQDAPCRWVTPLGTESLTTSRPIRWPERALGQRESSASLLPDATILTPLPRNQPESISPLRRWPGRWSARWSPDAATHDEYIAFTSQIPHVLSVAYTHSRAARSPVCGGAWDGRGVHQRADLDRAVYPQPDG